VHPDRRAERVQQPVQRPSQVAEADQADVGVPQQDRVGRTGRDVLLGAGPEGAVLPADAAGQVEREPSANSATASA
jgi:hypothetical protein